MGSFYFGKRKISYVHNFPFYSLKRIIYCSKETFEENEYFLVSYRLLGIDSKKKKKQHRLLKLGRDKMPTENKNRYSSS